MPRTEYLQGDDAREFMRSGRCDDCGSHAMHFADEDQYGNVEVAGHYDSEGDLVGFLCSPCADRRDENANYRREYERTHKK